MQDAARHQYDAFPEPSPTTVPVDAHQLDRLDDNLHFGWAWHRHRFCYRGWEGLRILDAGCGTGLSTLGLARLNPGSEVLGLDASAAALELARRRAEVTHVPGVDFLQHDLTDALSSQLSPFDFIVCRGVLGQAAEPGRLLEQLGRVLDDRGLLLVTLPARDGRGPARQLRRAVDALAPAGATLEERAEVGRALFEALRPDHPIRRFEAQARGPALPDASRIVAAYLAPGLRDWDLAGAVALLESSGFRFLYAAASHPWQPDRVFQLDRIPAALQGRVDGLDEPSMASLMDALDPSLHRDEYHLFACAAGFEPRLPAWPEQLAKEPAVIDRLVPHPTGLATPAGPGVGPAALPAGQVAYRAANGAIGAMDGRAHRLFLAADGRRSCGAIGAMLREQGLAAPDDALRPLWVDLANLGVVALESSDRRQHVDCVHLGPVRDRLDCACPRRWVRSCERHDFCTIDEVTPDDPRAPALGRALERLDVSAVMACARCPDYRPDE